MRILCLLAALFVHSTAFAQVIKSDSLIRLQDLSFQSDLERNIFTGFAMGQAPDPVDIFWVSYPDKSTLNSSEAHLKIDACVEVLRDKIRNKQEGKSAKIVYDYVHDTFFKVYKEKNSFCDVFKKGEYNCVSGTALYAIVFSKLGIPFQIEETPRHVFLEAYPATSKVLIETTSPEKGYYIFNDDFAERYVRNLYKTKLITREEMDSTSTTVLFNKYFFSSDNISLVQLAGLQYSNFGVYQSDDKKYNEAVEQLEKAYFIYPSERHKFLLKQLLVHQLSNVNYNTVEEVRYLAALCRYNNLNDEDVSDKNIQAEFSRVVQTQLINNSDYAKLDSSYLLVSSALEKPGVKNDIAFNYHYELARIGFVTGKDSGYELRHLKAAYQVNPRNADLHAIILAYFGHLFEGKDDPAEVMKLMDQYSQMFPFLDTNNHYNDIRGKCLLELSYQSYSLQNISSGDRFMKEFEVLADKQKEMKVEPVRLEKTYATAAGAYFRKGNYTKAKQVLKSGLTYAPGSFTLQQMLREF